MESLQNKVALITGASKGIGAATAIEMAARGASLVVNYRQAEGEAQGVVDKVLASGGTAIAVRADISVPEDVDRLFEAAKERYGHLDILVNNAGPMERKLFDEITVRYMDEAFHSTVKPTLLCMQAAVKLFPASGGVVINLSTETVRNIVPGASLFSGLKSTVEVLTRNLAQELGPRGIRVVCVAPGFTQTPATHWMEQSMIDDMVSKTALRRPGQAPDIAHVIAFLASDAAAWITGTTISVSGGLFL